MFANREDKSVTLITYFKENLKSFYKLRCYAKDVQSDYLREIEIGYKEKPASPEAAKSNSQISNFKFQISIFNLCPFWIPVKVTKKQDKHRETQDSTPVGFAPMFSADCFHNGAGGR